MTLRPLLACCLLLGAATSYAAYDNYSPSPQLVEAIQRHLPKGWAVSQDNNTIGLHRKEKSLRVPLYGRPPRSEDEAEGDYLERIGHRSPLTIRLRFEPRRTLAEYRQSLDKWWELQQKGREGFKSKVELSEHSRLEEKLKPPRFFTAKHEVFVDSALGPELHDEQAKAEAARILDLLPSLLRAHTQPQQATNASAASQEAQSSEQPRLRSFAKNEWYELFELRINETESFVFCDCTKTDPQLGIGVAIDIGVLADSRGFKYFRYVKEPVEKEKLESLKKQIEKLNSLSPRGTKIQSAALNVEFLTKKPEDNTGDTMEVQPLVALDKIREMESDSSKAEKSANPQAGKASGTPPAEPN